MTDQDPLWYKDAVIYELHVRAFHDSVGDGYGDFKGLTRKLDYLEDLGVTALWLLPFYPSPLRDDGYDIADYTTVNPQYGNLDDFKEFLQEAHRRGLRVITELVINHTSDQHPWFQRARRAPIGSPEREMYVWSDTPEKYQDARIIFKDFEPSNWTWDPVAKQYYWHRFYSHQPDLNFDNPAVWDALFPILDFWMEMGVDGMRLDAIPYLYEREGTNCENLPETHVYLKALRKHMDEKFPGRMFLAEANQWPEDAVAYFGDGDECNMSFHFPVMPRLFMALHQEDRFPILDILEQTPAIPDNCQWCMFLRNHDELTLEMVTDEERDYMYRAYAEDRTARINLGIRRRLAPLLKNDRRRIELMNALLFSLPGTPVLYYGDEIGMGDNIYLGDRNGVRTPMQWSSDRNAGFSRAKPQQLYLPIIIDAEYHYEAINVETQQNNPSSLLWWMKRMIALRKRYQAFGRGTLEFLNPRNSKVLIFVRKYQDERILVVANLSRFVQCVELDLKEYAGVAPEELFGRATFPRIGELPYMLTIGAHGFYWFSLPQLATSNTPVNNGDQSALQSLPILPGRKPLAERFTPDAWDDLERVLPSYLARRQSLQPGGTITSTRVLQCFPTPIGDVQVWYCIVRVEYRDGTPETFSVPLVLMPEASLSELLLPLEECGLARVSEPTPGVLCYALAVRDCDEAALQSIFTNRKIAKDDFEMVAVALPGTTPSEEELSISLRRSERNNTSVVYGESYVLKTFRRLEEGVSPDLEMTRFLTTHPDYNGAVPVVGYIEFRRRSAEPITLAVLHQYVPNQGTAWQQTLDHLSGFFERVAALPREQPPDIPAMLPLVGGEVPATETWLSLIGGELETARLLGRRTAELHLALSSNRSDPAFAPEPMGKLYQRSLYQSMRNLTGQLGHRLTRETLPAELQPLADSILAQQQQILRRFREILRPEMSTLRIRCHGDFHLGQLLNTGKDFVIVDFEGESKWTIGERRVKRSPLRDVANMVRSFDFAVQTVLHGLVGPRGQSPGVIRPEDVSFLEPWSAAWHNRVSRAYVNEYVEMIASSGLIPTDPAIQCELMNLFLLEKAMREIDTELSVRPDWAAIPMRAVLQTMTNDE